MTKFRSHLSVANVLSAAALFIALGAGAYAAETVHSDSVTPRSLDFALGGDGVTKNANVAGTDKFQKIARTKVHVDDQHGVMFINGAVEADNTSKQASDLTLRAIVNFKPDSDGPKDPPKPPKIEFSSTIGPDDLATGNLLGVIQPWNGTYTITLEGMGADLNFGEVSLGVEATPEG
jgi:hypothetical protein